MKEIFFEILMYFIIYSFLGWVMESIYRSVIERKLINTGFLAGPICPIYGIGANILILFFSFLEDKPIALFVASIIILTLWEYVVGVLLEKMFNTKYWDYSNHKINYKGRICLTNSICWGVLGVVFVKYLHPFIQKCILYVDRKILVCGVILFLIIAIIDMITSIIKMKNLKSTLNKIESINKEIKERLKEIKLLNIQKDISKSNTVENVQSIIEGLKKKRDKIMSRLYRNVTRLKKAFPAINTQEITEILNRKIDIKAKKEIKNKIEKKN
ncbi:MAG: putative ABC transporter permease [Clostridia bacterium]|nr:putative ABC transporter permease [Clostridia bacterium]